MDNLKGIVVSCFICRREDGDEPLFDDAVSLPVDVGVRLPDDVQYAQVSCGSDYTNLHFRMVGTFIRLLQFIVDSSTYMYTYLCHKN